MFWERSHHIVKMLYVKMQNDQIKRSPIVFCNIRITKKKLAANKTVVQRMFS